MAQKVIFQMATVKGSFVSSKICSNRHLTKCSEGKDKWKERLKEKVRSVPDGRRGFCFSGGERARSEPLFHQKALA